MQELENNLAMSNVIDLKNLTCEKVVFGTTVAIEETGTGKRTTYQLLGPLESDLLKEPDLGNLADRPGSDRQMRRRRNQRQYTGWRPGVDEIVEITVQEED